MRKQVYTLNENSKYPLLDIGDMLDFKDILPKGITPGRWYVAGKNSDGTYSFEDDKPTSVAVVDVDIDDIDPHIISGDIKMGGYSTTIRNTYRNADKYENKYPTYRNGTTFEKTDDGSLWVIERYDKSRESYELKFLPTKKEHKKPNLPIQLYSRGYLEYYIRNGYLKLKNTKTDISNDDYKDIKW